MKSVILLFFRDTPGGRPPCLHERASDGQQSGPLHYWIIIKENMIDYDGVRMIVNIQQKNIFKQAIHRQQEKQKPPVAQVIRSIPS